MSQTSNPANTSIGANSTFRIFILADSIPRNSSTWYPALSNRRFNDLHVKNFKCVLSNTPLSSYFNKKLLRVRHVLDHIVALAGISSYTSRRWFL